MGNAPEISVVIRGGEVNTWLERSVNSVLASEGVRLQVILVLNGPRVVIAPEEVLAEEDTYPFLTDSRVKVYRFDHYLGISGSMVEGVLHAHTEFIANVDGDDVVLPEKFAKQLRYMRKHSDCVLVGTRASSINDDDEPTGDIKMPFGEDIRSYLYLFNPVPHSSFFFRKSAIDLVGGYNPDLEMYEDYDLLLRLASLGKIAQLEERLVLYRVHQTNVSKGAEPTGPHIDAVTRGRRQLAKTLGTPLLIALPQHLAWRAIQFVRDAGVIRPLHEYSQRKK